eukprot:212359-Prymnesium_polylepis.1
MRYRCSGAWAAACGGAATTMVAAAVCSEVRLAAGAWAAAGGGAATTTVAAAFCSVVVSLARARNVSRLRRAVMVLRFAVSRCWSAACSRCRVRCIPAQIKRTLLVPPMTQSSEALP